MNRWRRHLLVAGVGTGIVCIASAWFVVFGDAWRCSDVDANGAGAYDPSLPPPTSALHYAETALRGYGGLPSDAVLVRAPRGDDGPLDFTWRPRDEAAWGDNIFVSLGGNVRTGLSVMRVHRRWTPWPVRLIREASVRLSTPLVPVPSSLNTRCKTVDMTALRRDLGSVLGADVPLHSLRRPYLGWDELVSRLSDTHTVAAHWDPPYPTLRVAEHDMTFTDALFTDGAEYAIRLAPESLQPPGIRDWYWFESALHDPVCPPRTWQAEPERSGPMQ